MRLPHSVLAFCLAAALTGSCSQSWAQTATPPSTPDFSGTWFGSFDADTSNGKVSHNTAVLVLKQSGDHVTGSAGSSIDQQTAFSDGTVAGSTLRFTLDIGGGAAFELHWRPGGLEGATLEGAAAGKNLHATLYLRPAVGLLPHAQLTAEIEDAEQRMYNAFSACDVQRFSSFFSSKVEFYQDRIGLRDYDGVVTGIKQRCAEGIQLRRELVPGSLIVNSVPGFGAIAAGVHRFYSRQPDGTEHLDATARFTNLWSKESGSWKIVRTISYDHH